MARTSKKSERVKETAQIIREQESVWNAGIYARLSVDNHNQKSESIDTQIQIAKDFIKKSDNIELVDCYVDLGKTGTDFERESFERMMADVRRRKINCIIVKDFSRFGRNYIETGNYIEKIFPFFNIRFIAISDAFDSHRTQGTNDMLAINLKNIVNELYARDCSEKVKAIKKSKLEQGCYVGGIPSYGYCGRWVDGKKILFPEESTAAVVKKIYALFDSGSTIREIISYLYGQHIHRPKEYQFTGHVYCEAGEILKQWSDQTIRTILTNPVYIGALVQIKTDENVKHGRGRYNLEPDAVIMLEHAHEPIIEEDMFYRISSKIEEKRKRELQKKRLPKDTLHEDIYKNFIYCGECGHKLKRICTSNTKSYCVSVRSYSYGCPNIGRIDSLKCDNHYISLNAINQIVMETMRKEFDLSGISAKAFVDYNCSQAEIAKRYAKEREKDIRVQIQELDVEMSCLYMQYREGKIEKNEFLGMKKNRETIKSDLLKKLSEQQIEEARIIKETKEVNRLIRCLWKGKENAVLDEQVITCLIKKIIVYKDRRVEIIFNFGKEQFESYKKGACLR